jgi:hypothetical protein
MRRREFMTFLAGTLAAWPPAARAQLSAVLRDWFLRGTSPTDSVRLVTAFPQGLKEAYILPLW